MSFSEVFPSNDACCTEDNVLYRKSSSLKMDEDFDIDKFTSSEANRELDDNGVNEDDLDDNFLDNFPEIEINGVACKKQSTVVSNSTNSRVNMSIAEYAIKSTNPVSKISSPEIPAIPSTSKGIRCYTNSRKRILSNIANDNHTENTIPKRSKLDTEICSPHRKKYELNMASQFIGCKTKNEPLNLNVKKENCSIQCYNQNDYDNQDTENDESDCNSEDFENRWDYNMTYPNLENINFDASTIPNKPQTHSYMNNLGKKGMQDYLRERLLTTECIEKLYDSLMKVPKDGIDEDPQGLNVQLMPHQKYGLKWMKWREEQNPSGGILADDMGLGKTLQMISLVLAAKNEKKKNIDVNNKDMVESDDDDLDIELDCGSRKIYNGKTLVICPASLIRQWAREVSSKCQRGLLSIYVYHGASKQIMERELAKFDLVITTYKHVMNEYELYVAPKKNKDSRIFKVKWERIILDEAHYIRNFKSKGSKAVCELFAKYKWALTGTPIQNKESDLYALLKFLKVSPFEELSVWKKWVSNNNSAGNQRLVIITKSLMLRRTKDELMSIGAIQKLPDKKLDIIYIKLDEDEKLAYKKLLLYSQTFFFEYLRQRKDKQHLKLFGCHERPSLLYQEVPGIMSKILRVLMKYDADIGTHFILVLILRLRQMCCHPALIKSLLNKDDIELENNVVKSEQINTDILNEINKLISDDEDDDDDDDYSSKNNIGKNIMSQTNPIFKNNRQSSKVRIILQTIEDVLNRGEKVIVVSQWVSFLKVIASNLEFVESAKYEMFTGKVNIKDRQLIVDRLNDDNDELNILLLSLIAGGVGLNLVGANNLLLIDLHWNPQLETQAEDRIYRFGQENNVHIYKFICRGTIEEKIKQLQDKKLEIAQNVLNGTVSNELTIEDLKLLFS